MTTGTSAKFCSKLTDTHPEGSALSAPFALSVKVALPVSRCWAELT